MSWFSNLKPKKESECQHNLTDIIRGIQWAVNSAINATENQYISTVQKFFDIQSDGSYKAKEVDIKIDETNYMKIPLVSLINPNGLMLKKMKVDMAVKIQNSTVKNLLKHDVNEESDITRSSFGVSFSAKAKENNGDVIKLSMEFESSDSPEGVSRILEQLTNTIQPYKKPNVTNTSEDKAQ